MNFSDYLNEDAKKTPYIKSLNALYEEFGHKSEIQNILKSISITEVGDEVRVYDGNKLKQTFEDTTNALAYILEYLAQKFNEKSKYDKFYCVDHYRQLLQADDNYDFKSSNANIINNVDKYTELFDDECLITKNTTREDYQNHIYYELGNMKDLNKELVVNSDFDFIRMLKDDFNITADSDFYQDLFEDLYDAGWWNIVDWNFVDEEITRYTKENNLDNRIAIYRGGEDDEWLYYSPIVNEIEDVIIDDIGDNDERLEGFGYIKLLTDTELKKISRDLEDIYNNCIDSFLISFIASSFGDQDKEDIIEQFSCISKRI